MLVVSTEVIVLSLSRFCFPRHFFWESINELCLYCLTYLTVSTYLYTWAIVLARPLPEPHGMIPTGIDSMAFCQSERSNIPLITSK